MLTSKNNDMSLGTKSGKMEVSGAVFSMKEKEIETVDLAQVIERIEKKVDRILEILEVKELPTSYKKLEIGRLCDLPDDVLRRNKLGKYAENRS